MAIYMQMTKISGGTIKGTINQGEYNQWIEVDHVNHSHGRNVYTEVGRANDRSISMPHFSQIIVSKPFDESSVGIFEAAAGGKMLEKVIIHCLKVGDDATPVIEHELSNVFISHVDNDFYNDGEVRQVINLDCSKVETKVTPFDADGSSGSPKVVGYDLESAKLS